MHLYNIPIVQPDLRHEEAIIQALNALEQLNNVINDVFDRVDARISENLQRVESVQKRIDTADQKAQSLMKINNKSITIFSPCKYPASEIDKLIPMTFGPATVDGSSIKLNEDYEVRSSMNPINHRNIQEKLQFYHVKTSKTEREDLTKIPDGLGKCPPSYVTSVNALLLFNTKENPYENYKTIDNLQAEQKPKHTENPEDGDKEIDAAPESIHNKSGTNKNFLDQIVYAPEMLGAPDLDLPMDLADLPGIANDISFNFTENEQMISPSAFNIKQLLSGPSPSKPEKSKPIVEPTSVKVEPKKAHDTSNNDTLDSKAVASVAPSPPPPPPPVMPQLETKPVQEKQPKTSAVAPDVRSSLMEAIRKAGGTNKLRATDERKVDDKPETEKKPAAPAMDLMSDLHNKLMMRRKGISGTKDQGGNVMDKISSMIPPPPPKLQQQQHNSSNSEESEEIENDWE